QDCKRSMDRLCGFAKLLSQCNDSGVVAVASHSHQHACAPRTHAVHGEVSVYWNIALQLIKALAGRCHLKEKSRSCIEIVNRTSSIGDHQNVVVILASDVIHLLMNGHFELGQGLRFSDLGLETR